MSEDLKKSKLLVESLLSGRVLAIRREFVDIAGDVEGALFLSQAFYWTDKSTEKDGWFYKTADDWEIETGLSRAQQKTIRDRLVSLNVLQEKKKGLPAKLFFRLNTDVIYDMLTKDDMELTPKQFEDIYASRIFNLSRIARAFAIQLERKYEEVSYLDILKKYNYSCYVCQKYITNPPGKKIKSMAFIHIVALSDGGDHVLENIKPVHYGCSQGCMAADKQALHAEHSNSVTPNTAIASRRDEHSNTKITSENTTENTCIEPKPAIPLNPLKSPDLDIGSAKQKELSPEKHLPRLCAEILGVVAENKKNWSGQIQTLTEAYGGNQVISAFEVWANEQDKEISYPISKFLKRAKDYLKSNIVKETNPKLEALAISLYKLGDIPFSGKNKYALNSLLDKYSMLEIESGYREFIKDKDVIDMKFAPKNFVEGAADTIILFTREEKARRDRMKEEMEAMAKKAREAVEAEEVIEPIKEVF